MLKYIQTFIFLISISSLLYASLDDNYVFIEGGVFCMGNDSGAENVKPIHDVTLDSFFLSKYEVTQEEYEKLMGYNPSYFKGKNSPVEQVTWYDAILYANKLSQNMGESPYYKITNIKKRGNNIISATVDINKSSKGYRLPTEAEWEYAAKLGKTLDLEIYDLDEISWNSFNSSNKTQPVGRKKENALGIYDMVGNVSEWCFDYYGDYDSQSKNNPIGPLKGKSRVYRGGSWYSYGFRDISDRNGTLPEYDSFLVGFRLVKSH